LVESKCRPGENLWSVKARLDQDITEAMPYLNAALKADHYDHEAKTLTCWIGKRHCAFRPREIAVAPVEDRDDATEAAQTVVAEVNRIWRSREDIEPSARQRELPNLMSVYKLLPGTNCKKCGYPTCMAFAADLREGKAELSACNPLSERPDAREKLSGLLGSAG